MQVECSIILHCLYDINKRHTLIKVLHKCKAFYFFNFDYTQLAKIKAFSMPIKEVFCNEKI